MLAKSLIQVDCNAGWISGYSAATRTEARFSWLAIEILVFIDRRSVMTNALHPLTVKTSNVARETLFLVKEVLEDCLLVRFVVEAQGSTGFSLNRKRPSHTDIIVLHVLIHHIKDLFETKGNELCLGLWYISRFRPSFLL
jgi:hypothetical protein